MIDQYIQAYGKRLYGLCLTLCKNRQNADDLYQDTWLKAMENIDKYRSEMPFEPWLTRICVNLYRNGLRRLTHSPFFENFISSEDKEQLINSVAEKPPDDYSDIHRAVDRLPEKLRLVIILFYFEDMEIKKVAEVLHIPEGTVKSRLNKARQKLKEELTNETDLQF